MTALSFPCAAFVVIDSWAGRARYRVTILRETPARFFVRNEDKPIRLNPRIVSPGDTWYVPKQCVVVGDPNAAVQP